jgi:hypothetical protein
MRTAEDAVRCARVVSQILAQCGLANKHAREPLPAEEVYVREDRPSRAEFDTFRRQIDAALAGGGDGR